jgi:diacylglycerol kinase
MPFSKLFKGFGFAFSGIRNALAEEKNLRIHCAAVVLVITAGCLLGATKTEWLALFISKGLVMGAELTNTAIERLCNFIEPNQHLVIKKIKDISAGAVLVAAIAALAVGLIVFIPKICNFF